MSKSSFRSERAKRRQQRRRTQQIALAVIAVVIIAILAINLWPSSPDAAGIGGDFALGLSDAEIITTNSGLQYQDEVVGDGAEALPGSTVSVHYTGWLTDGTKFDSSVDRGQPFSFPLGAGRVIQGWDEGVAGMRVGGVRILTIPSDLGYGPNGYPPEIPGGATLIFQVELLEVQ